MEILRVHLVKKALKKFYPEIFQWTFLILFFIFLLHGLFGPPFASQNALTYGVWILWWTFLPFILLLSARAWCGVCPIGKFSDIIGKKGVSLKPPRFILKRGIWIILLLFLIITYLDWGYGITSKPKLTLLLFVFLFGLAGIAGFLFRGRIFCTSFCPIGPLTGIYATSSILQYRPKNVKLQNPFLCPVYTSPVKLKSNKDCILCFQCFRKVKKGSYSLRVGLPKDENFNFNTGERSFLIVLAPLVFLQTFQMTKIYPSVMKFITVYFPLHNYDISFILLFSFIVLIFLLYYLLSKLSFKDIKSDFLYLVIPLMLATHIIHSVVHIVSEFKEKLGLLPPGREWVEAGFLLKGFLGFILILGFIYSFFLIFKGEKAFKWQPVFFITGVFIFYISILFMPLGLSHIH